MKKNKKNKYWLYLPSRVQAKITAHEAESGKYVPCSPGGGRAGLGGGEHEAAGEVGGGGRGAGGEAQGPHPPATAEVQGGRGQVRVRRDEDHQAQPQGIRHRCKWFKEAQA